MSNKVVFSDLTQHLPEFHRAVIQGEWGFVAARIEAGEILTQKDDAGMTAVGYLIQSGRWETLKNLVVRYPNVLEGVIINDEYLPSFVDFMMEDDDQNHLYYEIASRFNWAAWHIKSIYQTEWQQVVPPADGCTVEFIEELICYSLSNKRWDLNEEMILRIVGIEKRIMVSVHHYISHHLHTQKETIISIIKDALDLEVDHDLTEFIYLTELGDIYGRIIFNSNGNELSDEYEPFLLFLNDQQIIVVKGEYDFDIGTLFIPENAYKVNCESVYAW